MTGERGPDGRSPVELTGGEGLAAGQVERTASGAAVSDFAPGLERAFAVPPAEQDGPAAVRGKVPGFLRGSYLLNGPARFVRGAQRYQHWLDGDGMVAALTLTADGAHVTARYVQSTKHSAEEAAGAALFRTFGTSFPGDRLVRGVALESPVNVSVYPWAGHLLALGEQGLPWELDPHTLETRGPYTFGRALNPLTPFAAHPKIDPETGELFNFGVSFASQQPTLNVYRFAATGEQTLRRRHALADPCSLHDFLLAPRHLVFHLGPYLLDMARLADGGTLMESLAWRPDRGSQLLILDRASGDHVATIPLPTGYVLHTVNAWEDGGRLVVDVVELERPVYDQYQPLPNLFQSVGPGGPVRYVVDLEQRAVVHRQELTYRQAPDFPSIDPRRFGRAYDDLWLLGISAMGHSGRKFFDQLARLSWSGGVEVWQAPAGSCLGGEPAFAPDPAGDGGAILCQRLDMLSGQMSFLIFDAFDLAAGPRAEVLLDRPLHLGFHAVWVPATSPVA
jgi:carotenoid cleavage dioxygenase